MNREKTIIRTSIIGILGNVGLVALKATIGFIAGSISIIMDAVNNLSDALSSVITIIGTKVANKKPDRKHPYGHGRVEYITSLIVAVIILVAGGSAIYESIQSLINPVKAIYTDLSLIIISIAIVVKVALGLYFRAMGKKTKSDALKGSGLDALFDALLSLTILIGAIVSRYTGVIIEGYLGILVGLFIIKSGVEILISSLSNIVGKRVENQIALDVKQLVNSFPEVIGAYDLILHDYGPNKTIGSIHIEVRDDLTAKEIHPLTRKITEEVYQKYGIILTVGIYATNESTPEIKCIRKDLYDLVKQTPEIKQIHGFYVDMNIKVVTFDLVIDFKVKNQEEVKNMVIEKITALHPDYQFLAILDADYSD